MNKLEFDLFGTQQTTPIQYEQFEDIMLQKSITTKVLAWQPKKDLTGRPIYVRLDPDLKKAIVRKVEQQLSQYIIGAK